MKKTNIKDVAFKLALIFQIPALVYFLVYSCTFIDSVGRLLSGLGISRYFLSEGMILPLVFVTPAALLGVVAVLVFYRKETTTLLRVMLPVLFVWEIASFFAVTFINSPDVPSSLAFLNLIPVAGFVAAAVVIIKELTRKKA